jgi:hypothetical protein
MELDGHINVRQDAQLLGLVTRAKSKVVETGG